MYKRKNPEEWETIITLWIGIHIYMIYLYTRITYIYNIQPE